MKLYDTCSLLLAIDRLKECDEKFALSSITLEEIESIKTSSHKDENIKYAARQVSKFLSENEDRYFVIVYNLEIEELLNDRKLPITNDNKIIATAASRKLTFVTNDLNARVIARQVFILPVETEQEIEDEYCGFLKIVPTEDELCKIYSNPTENIFNALINQYVLLFDAEGAHLDTLCWTGEEYRKLNFHSFDSTWFGSVRAKKNDWYQMCAMDSLLNNQITCVRGPAATGKSLLSMSYLFSALDRGKIDKIIVFCNPVAARHAARLGFYPGDKNEKLLDSQIGNFLVSKLGDRDMVQDLIDQGTLLLLPFADIRGFDTSGMRAGVYITEAQNLDIDLMKLALQRIGEDSICILDGDDKAQIDMVEYSGSNNGLRKASKVFRNHNIYGEVELKNIYRSKIAAIANEM